jgi:phage terminase large subunit-like protein
MAASRARRTGRPEPKRSPARPRRQPPDPVTRYALDVAEGRIVANRYVRLAAQRHLDDLRNGPKRALRWDREAAEYALAFFPGWLRLAEGPFAGEPFVLQPWQQFVVGSLFGWYREDDGTRRFRTAYIECGKGNGKTPLAAGIGLFGLVADGEPAAEIYTAGVTREQANYILADARKMVERSPALRARVQINAHNLAVVSTGSYMRSVSSEARSLDQRRVHMALIDEIHEHPTDLVVDKMRAGTKGRRNPLIVEITNAGYDRHSICWRHHDYSAKVLEGAIQNDSWFAMLFGLDEGDDWTDERVWPKANPNLGVSVSLRYLREQVAEALAMPAQASIVKRLNFCVWVEASAGAVDMRHWDQGAEDPQIAAGDEVYAALDLASTTDLTAFVVAKESPDGVLDVLAWFWCPEEGIRQRSQRDHVPYELWVREGWIRATPGNVTDYDQVRRDVRELAGVYRIRALAYDRWNATQLITQLQEDGANCIPMGQGFASLAAPTRDVLTKIAAGKIRHGGNPVLRWMASNLVVETDAAGNQKPSKARSTEKIDGMVALIMAQGLITAGAGEVPQPSVYEKRGVLTW